MSGKSPSPQLAVIPAPSDLPAAEQDAIYADISRLIDHLQAVDTELHHQIAVSLLMITRWLYLAARQYQQDAELYRQAADRAAQRELEIKELLSTTLLLARALELPGLGETLQMEEPFQPVEAPPEAHLHPTDGHERPGLRGYLQRILGWIQQDFQGASPAAQPDQQAALETPPTVIAGPAAAPIDPEADNPTQDDEPQQLVVYCLGAFKAYWGNQPINRWYGLKGMMIFKYLLAHRAQPLPKELLMDVFWPETDPEAARRNLHQAVYSLRRTLRPACQGVRLIIFENDCYQLNPEVAIWLDMEEFQHHRLDGLKLEQVGRLPEALVAFSIAESLYHADFLEEDLYEEWTIPHRQHLRETYQDLAGRLSEHYYNQSEFTAAIAICRRLIRLDGCNEEAHRRLMQCYLAQGQRHLAIRQYLTCVDALEQELNLLPSPETVALYHQLTQHTPEPAPHQADLPGRDAPHTPALRST